MPVLEYSITGDNSGLVNATNRAIANIENLTNSVNNANISLQFKNGIAALDNLSQKLLVVQGNSSLFGDSIKNQTQELGAYQTALNSLLSSGYAPMDADVQRLKGRIDELNASIKATPTKNRDFTGSEPDSSNREFANSVPINPNGLSGTQILLRELNRDFETGAISAEQFRQAVANIGTAQSSLASSTQQVSAAVEQEQGYIAGLKQALAELNAQRINAPVQDLQALNAEIQETEIALQQAGNIGKQGFDAMGNAIRGVSVQNINGQLLTLNNNLFGARQIAKDVVRTFDATNLSGYAKGIGLLAVDFLYYAQGAQFAAGATNVASAAIGTEATVASAGAISTGALGAAFASLLTPLNLVILGIAIAGGGLLAYEKSQKSASAAATEHLKAIREQKAALADYLTTLSSSQQVQAKASETSAAAILKLDELVYAIRNNTGALFDGKSALDNLQSLYPAFFANIDTAKSKTDALTIAYNGAKDALKALGEFTAANSLAEKSIESSQTNQVAANSLVPQLAILKKQLADAKAATAGGTAENIDFSAFQLAKIEQQYNDVIDKIKEYNTAVVVANKQTQAFYDIANKNAPKAGKVSYTQTTTEKTVTDPFAEIQDTINGIISKTAQLNNVDGLTGYAADVEKINKEYGDLAQSIEKVLTLIDKGVSEKRLSKPEGKALTDLLQTGTAGADGNQNSALQNAKITNAQKTADAIQAINDSFAVKAEVSRLGELNQVKKLADDKIAIANKGIISLEDANAKYDEAVKNANGNQDQIDDAARVYDAEIQMADDASVKVIAIKAGELASITAINDRYLQQERDLYAKIEAIVQQSDNEADVNNSSEVARIQKTYDERLRIIKEHYDKLRAIQKTGNPIADALINANLTKQQSTDDKKIKADEADVTKQAIYKPLVDGIDQAAANFYTTLTQINQQTDQSFKAIFADLAKQLSTSLNSVFLNVVVKGLETALQTAIKNGTSSLFNTSGKLTGLGVGVAAAGLAGGLISGATPQTSTSGQALGGALSGAAAGFAIGGPYGAAIGGAIGLLGGILGASKAQKALQEQQLAQQQEQTALLKAQLAYTSSIIGRDTVNGIITNINVGAEGQLVATVSGSDLQFVLSRAAKVR